MTIPFYYTFMVHADKMTDDVGEHGNARVQFQFEDNVNNVGYQFFRLPRCQARRRWSSRGAERTGLYPAGALDLACTQCRGQVYVHVDAGATVGFDVLANSQGNAVWIPKPSTAALAAAALMVVLWRLHAFVAFARR